MKVSHRDKGSTALLCFFLGWAGAHRFYVGKQQSGAVQLAMTALAWVLMIAGGASVDDVVIGSGGLLLTHYPAPHAFDHNARSVLPLGRVCARRDQGKAVPGESRY